jgi:hypothetical protein
MQQGHTTRVPSAGAVGREARCSLETANVRGAIGDQHAP